MSQNFLEILLLDERDAMSRLGGNTSIYAMLLRKFTENTYIEQMESAAASGNAAEAAEITHTVKGLAANLSLSRLHAVAAELDAAYKKGESPAGLPGQLKDVYGETLAAIRDYLA